MADPLSIVAGVVGIIGFGVQIARILQKEINEITTATERVEQIVIEIRATATGLTNLKEFLLEDANASENQIFNGEGLLEVTHIVRHCNTVFRNITVLVAKAGSGVLSQVDLYQHKMEEVHKKQKPAEDIDTDIKLDIELSNLEHLTWPWRLPKIQQYLADMDRLKLSLVLILSVANLAKSRRQKTIQAIKGGTSDRESDQWEGSDAETLVQDEIFYQDQGLREAEQKLKSLIIGPSAPDATTRSKQSAAKLLIQSWPNSPSGQGLCSISEIHDAGVILENHALKFHNIYDTNIDSTITEMPLNFQTIQQNALRRRYLGIKKPCNVWEEFSGLPPYQQDAIWEFLSIRRTRLYGPDQTKSSRNSRLVLVSVYRDNFRWRRSIAAFKRFLTLDVSSPWGRYILFIVIARVASDSGGGEDTLESDSQESDSVYDSNYSSSPYLPRRRRSRYRRRRGRGGSSSRSRSPGERHSIAGALFRKVAPRSAKILQRWANKRRSRSRSRSTERSRHHRARNAPYASEGSDNDDVYGAETYPPETYLPEPYPPTPQRTKTDKTTNDDGDVPDLRRVETLKEDDKELNLSSLRATQDDGARKAEVIELPPPRRKTATFNPDTNEIPDHSKGAAANAPAIAKTRSGTGKFSEVPEPGISRRDTTKHSSRGWGLIHRSRTARTRSRSRSRNRSRGRRRSDSIEIVRRPRRSQSRSRSMDKSRRLPFIRRTRSRPRRGYYDSQYYPSEMRVSRRSRSRGGYYESPPPGIYHGVSRQSRRSRRSHGEASGGGMQLLTSSPSRPIIRTFEDDGIPPTQRDKAAVAEYYLRKWTTAYQHARGGSLYRRGQPQSRPLEPVVLYPQRPYRNRPRHASELYDRQTLYIHDANGLLVPAEERPLRSRNRSRSRSRTMRRASYTRDEPGLVEYISDPLYSDKDATAGTSDNYYPLSNYFPPPPQGRSVYDERKSPEDASGKAKDAHDEGRRSDLEKGDPDVETEKRSADKTKKSEELSRFEEVGGEEDDAGPDKDNDKRYTLEIPRMDQRAYAESVSELESGLVMHGSQQTDRNSNEDFS